MWTLLTDPLGRALLTLLTTDYGLPGDPQRKELLRELQELRAVAEARGAPLPVKRRIRSALLALRAEFPAAIVIGSPDQRDAAAENNAVPSPAYLNYNRAGSPRM